MSTAFCAVWHHLRNKVGHKDKQVKFEREREQKRIDFEWINIKLFKEQEESVRAR